VTQTVSLEEALVHVAKAGKSTFVQTSRRVAAAGNNTEALQFFSQMDKAVELMETSLEGGKVSLEELQEVAQALGTSEAGQEWLVRWETGKFRTSISNALLAMHELVETQEEFAKIQAEAPGQRTQAEVLERLEQFRAVGGVSIEDMLSQPATDAQTMSTALGSSLTATSDAVSPASQLSSHWKSIAASAKLAATASQGVVTPAMVASGGPIRFLASGGFARGTDQIPAMLSEGERVTNAKSSQRFASQLTAINAGVQPVYRESGGTVTTIGDVSINVTEAQSAQMTGREVMKSFRREIRRGSGRL
jgi:cell division protein ZapA (FtsZ GTPase activity inhibitor)